LFTADDKRCPFDDIKRFFRVKELKTGVDEVADEQLEESPRDDNAEHSSLRTGFDVVVVAVAAL